MIRVSYNLWRRIKCSVPVVLGAFCILFLDSALAAYLKNQKASELQLISMTVGRVEKHTITSREVQMNYLLELALYNPQEFKRQKNVLEIKDKVFAKELSNSLLSWVVYLESQDFVVANVPLGEEERALKVIKSLVKNMRAWNQLEVSADELKENVMRKLRVKKFVHFRAEASEVAVSDEEALKYYEMNRNQFGDVPFSKLKANIKTYLKREQVKSRLKIWFDVLKAKYDVQNYMFDSV